MRSIAVVLAVLLGSAHLAYSAEPLLGAGAGSADVPRATASAAGKSPAPITVICGPNGLTISSSDLEALDQFERMLATAAQRSGNGPLAIFYLKYAKAQAVAEELEKILAGGSSDAEGSSEQGPDSSRRRALATGSIKITPETRLNALLVLANRADQATVKQLLKILDLKGSPEENAVSPKPRMIPVAYSRATEIAEVLRQVYADQLVVAQVQGPQGPGGNMPFSMDGGMPGGDPGGGGAGGGPGGGGGGRRGGVARSQGGQNNRADQANRISIGVDTHTNTLIVAATDPVFEEVKQLVQKLDAANAEQHETVRMVTLHRSSAAIVQKALSRIAGDAVRTSSTNESSPPATNPATNRRENTNPATSRGPGRTPGGSPGEQSPMGGGGPEGSRFQPPGGPGQ